ncbi:MAG TPA: EndoU domain-containing protein [Pseudomonadota bacterium]|nr:EndoU domain-containing protein [Pseudomonadota bacterium]
MRADGGPLIGSVPLAVSSQCGFLGDCAHTDAIGLHLGTTAAVRFTGSGNQVGLTGLLHGSLTFLELLELGGAIGGHYVKDEAGASQAATAPALLFVKLRLYPLVWQRSNPGGLQLSASYQRSLVSESLGTAEQPGFDLNTARLLASRSLGPVDLDVGAGVVIGEKAPDLRRALEVSASAALRIYGLARPRSPDEQLRVLVQGLYRAALPGSVGPASEAFVLLGIHERTSRGYGFGLSGGPQLVGQQKGGLILASFDISWGLRYRNPISEAEAGRGPWLPGFWMNLFYVDPVLEADGCVWTDPNPVLGRLQIKCVGRPDPKEPATIVLDDGRRLPVGTHLWIRNDGLLVTQRLEELAQLDKQTTERALFVQKLGHLLYRAEKKEGKPCAFKADILRGTDPGLASQIANDDFGGAAALLGVEFARQILCGDDRVMSGAGFLTSLGKGLRRGPLRYRGQPGEGEGVIEHAQPVKPTAASLPSELRTHIFHGEVDTKQGRSLGWHYEPSGDRAKGTYVQEGTRSAPNEHGVYEANVVIEGIQKRERSSFFPKDWTPERVEKAILEAYENGKPYAGKPWIIEGKTTEGMKIEIRTKGGKIQTAYPVYKEP